MRSTIQHHQSVALYFSECLSRSNKTQKQIADECGFERPNIITMMKSGATRVPIGRVGALAKSLDIDPADFLRRVMREYHPETWAAVESVMDSIALTKDEVELVQISRAALL